MKIDALDIYHVAMPLIYPFRTAFGNDAIIESVLVKISSGDSCGWGESSPWQYPAYSCECASTQFIISTDMIAPALTGRDFATARELQQAMAWIKGNQFAKAAFDIAFWDLAAKQVNKPLWQYIGGVTNEIEAGADFGIMENVDLLLKTIDGAVKDGYRRVKLKYRPGWELEMISAVRKQFSELVIHVDCNSAYTLQDIDMLRELDKYNLKMIEQPLMHDDLIDHAKLQRQIKTPVCLDESITSADKARKAIEIKACQWINIKPGRVGGITNAIDIHNIAMENSIPCWIGGMLESAVGGNACMALATLPNIKYPSDIFPTSRFYHEDLSSPALEHSSCPMFKTQSSSGLGVEPVSERLAKVTINHQHISS